VFIYTPSGAEDRVNVMSDTILEIPGVSDWEQQHNTPPSEGFFADLLQGTIKWFTPETPGERRRREQVENNPFNVLTPTIVVGTRGTDFVIHHDPAKKQDFVFLNSGKIELSAS